MGFVSFEKPGKIESHAHTASSAGVSWLYLNSPNSLPVTHIQHCYGSRFKYDPIPPEYISTYSHCLQWPGGYPTTLLPLVELLENSLTIPASAIGLDLGLALDWYKNPDPDLPSNQWPNTEVGELVYRAKYFLNSPNLRRDAGRALIRQLAGAIHSHPAMNAAQYIVSVPGSNGDGSSIGELIAKYVAQATGKILISTSGPQRPARKEDQSYRLDGKFSIEASLSAPCVIVDDVIRSGTTIREVATVARRAGAPRIYGLVAAKTLRR